MNVSFAGCGFLGIYHVGVAACFRKYAPHLIVGKVSGASAGAIAACFLLCDADLGQITSDVLQVVTLARSKTLGPFSPSFNIQKVLKDGLMKNLPEDAHIRVSGKLHVSMTRVYDHKNVIVSHFNSRDDLIQALMCSSFIPFFCGWLPPRFRGIRYMDGCYSNNLPILDENTITVSPFCGESDICPRDDCVSLVQVNLCNTSIEVSHQNLYRFTGIMWPPSPETLSKMCQQGFDDTLRFLHRNNLINCTRCLSVHSTFRLSDTLDESIDYDPNCIECKQQRKEAMLDGLPETVVNILQEAIDSTNKGLMNWLFNNRSMTVVAIMSLPCIVPADMMYATFLKFLEAAPKLKQNLILLGEACVDLLKSIVLKVAPSKQLYSAKFECQLNITEYRDSKSVNYDVDLLSDRVIEPPAAPYDTESTRGPLRRASVKNKMNFGFSVNMDNRENVPVSHSRPDSHMGDDDTFERILDVATHQDALMAFYYLDENNQVKVTEIFDVTEADTSAVLQPEERLTNSQLEYDNWALSKTQRTTTDLSESIDDNYMGDSLFPESNGNSLDLSHEPDTNIFSDPESEWQTSRVPPLATSSFCSDSAPESDRNLPSPNVLHRRSSYSIMKQ